MEIQRGATSQTNTNMLGKLWIFLGKLGKIWFVVFVLISGMHKAIQRHNEIPVCVNTIQIQYFILFSK